MMADWLVRLDSKVDSKLENKELEEEGRDVAFRGLASPAEDPILTSS
jgi:hypothetical protein